MLYTLEDNRILFTYYLHCISCIPYIYFLYYKHKINKREREMNTNIYNVTLKNIPEILKELKERGMKVAEIDHLVKKRQAFDINGTLMTDYELLNNYPWM